jgi:AsmA protein
LIGARQGSLANMPAAILPGEIASLQKQPRVLPALPFHTERWNSVDADVKLQAKTIASSKALPFENLQAHLLLQDSVLTLEPITFGFSGGKLSANVTLDGRHNPILARANVRARKLQLGKMFPALDLTKKSLGELNGDFDLMGNGNSVGRMLATSNGKLAVMVSGGQISRLLMEKAGLHVWEIVTLTLTGDKLVKLRCFVADFEVKQGTMKAQALVFDTQVTTLMGSGTIDLAKEQLDLKLDPHTKTTSPLALRSPIYVRGSFAKPVVGVDKGKVALRAAGAVVLSMLNPFLALLPLVDTGPGKDTDCTQFRKFGAIRPTVQQRTEQIPGRG